MQVQQAAYHRHACGTTLSTLRHQLSRPQQLLLQSLSCMADQGMHQSSPKQPWQHQLQPDPAPLAALAVTHRTSQQLQQQLPCSWLPLQRKPRQEQLLVLARPQVSMLQLQATIPGMQSDMCSAPNHLQSDQSHLPTQRRA